jgi:hypothetical protein
MPPERQGPSIGLAPLIHHGIDSCSWPPVSHAFLRPCLFRSRCLSLPSITAVDLCHLYFIRPGPRPPHTLFVVVQEYPLIHHRLSFLLHTERWFPFCTLACTFWNSFDLCFCLIATSDFFRTFFLAPNCPSVLIPTTDVLFLHWDHMFDIIHQDEFHVQSVTSSYY